MKAGSALPAEGLAHMLIRLAPGRLLRVPRFSQVASDPAAHIAYQAESFRRAAPSGHVPALYGTIAPGDSYPLGALEVAEISGHLPRLDSVADFAAIGRALGRIHALPVPSAAARAPLRDLSDDPLGAMVTLIRQQARSVAEWPIPLAARHLIAALVVRLDRIAQPVEPFPLVTLCMTDCHPGNFLIQADGRAIFVDLERAQYGVPAFDLMHATTWPAIAWDPRIAGEITEAAPQSLLAAWSETVPRMIAEATGLWLPVARHLIALRSVTWLGRFLAEGLDRLPEGGAGWAADRAAVAKRIAGLLDPARLEAALIGNGLSIAL